MSVCGNLFIVSAPSGAGKSSLISALLNNSPTDKQVSISHTTRQPRPGEVNGEHYYFVSEAEFKSLIEQDAFFEWAQVFDNYYGTSKTVIEETLSKGIDVFLDIDWQGAQQVKRIKPDAIGIFILPPSKNELMNRLTKRGQDSNDVIAKRMTQAISEMSHYNEYEFIIINDNFETALAEFNTIINCQRLTKASQTSTHSVTLNDLLAD